MANESKKDFNAMLHDSKGMPRRQEITDTASIAKYGGRRMLLAPPLDYDALMRQVPPGRLTTVGLLRQQLAERYGADFTDPITAGIFVSIAAWAAAQRGDDAFPWWRTLRAEGELNPKYPGGIAAQQALLEAEGHRIVRRGRTNLRYYAADYRQSLFGEDPEKEA